MIKNVTKQIGLSLIIIFIISGTVYAWSGLTASDGDSLTHTKWNELYSIVSTNSGKLVGVSNIAGEINVETDGWNHFDIIGTGSNQDGVLRIFSADDFWSFHNDDSEGNTLSIRYNNSEKIIIGTGGSLEIAGDLTLTNGGGGWVDRPFAEQNGWTMRAGRQNKYRRFGKTVCANISAQRTTAAVSSGIIFSNFPIPSEPVYFPAYGYNSAWRGAGVYINTSGQLYLESVSGAVQWIQTSVCYEAASSS